MKHKHYQNYIDGKWIDAISKETINVYSPANEELVGVVQNSNEKDAQYVLEVAQQAQKLWRKQPARARAELLRLFANEIRNQKEYLSELITCEQGKLHSVAKMEVEVTATFIEYACDWARSMDGDIVQSDNPDEHIWIHKIPRGVVVGITAWNFPLALAGRKIGPALVAGNSMILKPTTETPLATLELGNIATTVGMPKGVLNIVTGPGRTLGDALVRNRITKMISMTGSTPAGQAIIKATADNLAHVQLELGGKAPFIVLEDADLEVAANAALHSRFDNCGQVCTCNERLYVQASIYDQFMDIFLPKVKALKVGDPMDDETDIGPKVNASELANMEHLIEVSQKEGAEILCGGNKLNTGMFEKGFWFEPTILGNVTQDMTIVHEESFGPILPVIKFEDLDQAIAYANDSDYGLAAMVCTKDMKNILRLVDALEAGEIYINRGHGEQHQGFHNGYKLSGSGGEDGKYGFEQYLEKKTFYVNFDS